jgi:ParB family transcriptional regulator, chromosome partitioning protein
MKTEYLNIDKIFPDKEQPRKKTGFEKEAIEELANSIKEVGIIVPLLIQENGMLIDGERRWRASKLLGIKKVPVVYNDNLTDVQRLEYQLIASLNATSCAEEEIAPKIKEYIDRSKFSNYVAATRLGRNEAYIRLMIKQLADLNKDEKDIIKLWRDTKGEKGIAPSNLAEILTTIPLKIF